MKKNLRSDVIWNAALARFDGMSRVRRIQRSLGRKTKQPGNFMSRHTVVSAAMPNDLLYTIARALEHQAQWYRNDTGHAPEAVAELRRDAGRLDAIAAYLDAHEVQP